MQRTVRGVYPFLLLTLGLLVGGCAGGSNTATGRKAMDFTVNQQAPHIDVSDLGGKGDSAGDTEEIYATLTRDGKPAGHVSIVMTIEDMPNDVVGTAGMEERLVLASYILPDGEIMVGGTSMYPVGGRVLNANEPTVRPVIGGTKAYLGARGEVTTVRQPDQTYVHQFHLIGVETR